MKFITILFLILPGIYASENAEQDSFFLTREKELIEQYRLCTGDTATTAVDSLLRWKNSINLRTEMPEYKEILREFIQTTGIIKDILPCQVLNWHLARLHYLKSHEDSLQHLLLMKSDYTVDSFRVSNELKQNPASKFDFSNMPFGLSKKVFGHLLHQKFAYPVVDIKRYLLIEHFPLADNPFLVKFYFNRYTRYYQYDIESYRFSGDSLNTVVRMQAALLKDYLAQRIGPPDRVYRIGYFDIKSGIITPYAKWERDDFTVIIGLSIQNNRYFTRATVTYKKLVDEERFRKNK